MDFDEIKTKGRTRFKKESNKISAWFVLPLRGYSFLHR